MVQVSTLVPKLNSKPPFL